MNVVKISEKIIRSDNGNSVTLILNGNTIKDDNMQMAGNAFEGWACAIKAREDKKVILDVKKETIDIIRLEKGKYAGRENGHICRFLYRVIKFQDQYGNWFSISEDLKEIVDNFKKFLGAKDRFFVNNPPTKDAEDNSNKENIIESKLAERGKLKEIIGDTIDDEVYRQLPVGLFATEKNKDNSIFTYGHSAIDLWSIKEDTISIVELKAKNKMIGIITEIFFYVNYINDFVNPNGQYRFELVKPLEEDSLDSNRGYIKLYTNVNNKKIKNVVGIMLVDDEDGFHTYIDQSVINVMNDNNAKLTYIPNMYHISDFNIVKSKNEKSNF